MTSINQKAPVVQKKQTIIHSSPEKIWEILTDIDNWSKWNSKIRQPHAQETIGIGSTFTWKINGSKIRSKIHFFSPHEVFGWTGKTLGASAIHNWYLEATENGTKVIVEESMEGWIIQLMKRKINQKLAEDMAFWLEQLKKESESLSNTKI